MPATPKSPRSSKKNGPAKTKGAVRAKSGCYTCRIRRKKCDEHKVNEDGPCQTCFRLKLECLGFGAKRPDWLRESSKVSAIRDKIKNHLASQGMIKGHSGSGTRTAVQQDTLRLSDYKEIDVPHHSGSGSSSSGSPAPRDLSVESDPTPTFVRYHHPVLDNSAPLHGHGVYGFEPAYHNPFTLDNGADLQSSRCVSPSVMSSNNYMDSAESNELSLYHTMSDSPAIRSSFSKFHNYIFDGLLSFDEDVDPDASQGEKRYSNPATTFDRLVIEESVGTYVANIVKIQYLLGDADVLPRMIHDAISFHELSHEAVRLLTTTYQRRQNDPTDKVLNDAAVASRITDIRTSLQAKDRSTLNADDAMTALHLISLYLFVGGSGRWDKFLPLAAAYVMGVLKRRDTYNSYAWALTSASQKEQFIVKTTIWFDVLSSVTTQSRPLLYDAIDQLFNPRQSGLDLPREYSMLTPMGCENDVLWAMSQATYLASWKRKHLERADLSIMDLVARGRSILHHLKPRSYLPPVNESEIDRARHLSSELFRTATILFVHSILAGDFPHVRDIRHSVEDVMTCIRRIPYNDSRAAIVRSTVFPLFICGALTDNEQYQLELTACLQLGRGEDGVGNCSDILQILQSLWREGDKHKKKNRSINWRQALKDKDMLLV